MLVILKIPVVYLCLVVWWAIRFPLVSMPVVAALGATVLAGWGLGAFVVMVCAVGYGSPTPTAEIQLCLRVSRPALAHPGRFPRMGRISSA